MTAREVQASSIQKLPEYLRARVYVCVCVCVCVCDIASLHWDSQWLRPRVLVMYL